MPPVATTFTRFGNRTHLVTLGVVAAGISSFALLYAPQPLLPALSERFDLTPGGASLAISVATAALAVAVLPIAALSELAGRRKIIIISVVASAVLGVALPFAPSYPVLLGIRALQGVAIAGFPGVASAYLVEELGRAGVAGAVGAMIAGNTVGGMTGRLAAGTTAEWLGWHGALAVVTAIALACSTLAVVALPRVCRPRRQQGSFTAVKREQSSLAPRVGAGARLRSVLVGLGVAVRKPVLLAQYTVALLAMGSFVALYNAAGFRLTGPALGLSPAIASLVFLAYAMGAFSSATAGRLVARFGRTWSLVCALAVTAFGTLLTLPDVLWLVVAGFVVLTGGFFCAHAVANGWAAAEAPVAARGQVSGFYTLAYYLGSSVGGTVGSVVYGRFGWAPLIAVTVVWLALAGGTVAVTSGLLRAGQRRQQQSGVPGQ